MKTIDRWEKVLLPSLLKTYFTPRLQQDILRIPAPETLPPLQSTYLWGNTGTGKTLCAAWMMLESMKQAYLNSSLPWSAYQFTSVPNLLTQIRATFDDPTASMHDLIAHYSTINFLVLDELGVDKTTDWVLQVLYQIINNRYENLLTTIITSNFDLTELSQVLGDDRITSRIERGYVIIRKRGFQL